jgi:hypothetical protein
MQMFESQEKLGTIKPAALFIEALLPLQMVEELATIDETEIIV